jgi:hypothetical protein
VPTRVRWRKPREASRFTWSSGRSVVTSISRHNACPQFFRPGGCVAGELSWAPRAGSAAPAAAPHRDVARRADPGQGNQPPVPSSRRRLGPPASLLIGTSGQRAARRGRGPRRCRFARARARGAPRGAADYRPSGPAFLGVEESLSQALLSLGTCTLIRSWRDLIELGTTFQRASRSPSFAASPRLANRIFQVGCYATQR